MAGADEDIVIWSDEGDPGLQGDLHNYLSAPILAVRDWDPTLQLSARRRRRRRVVPLTIVLAGGLVGIGYYLQAGPDRNFLILGVLGAITVGLAALADFLVGLREKTDSAQDRSGQVGALSDGDLTVERTEQEINRLRLLEYQRISQRQASSSYRFSQGAIGVGLVVLAAGATVAYSAQSVTGQLVVGGLATLGSSISAYLSATYMKTYNRSLAQMNYYYAQPLVHSYILQALDIARQVSVERRDKVLEDIITTALDSASVAASLISDKSDSDLSGTKRRSGLRTRSKGQAGSVSSDA